MSEQTQTETQTQTPPSVTIDDKKYLCSDLSDRANLILSDLTRTVLEYKELMRNYNQSLTLTNTYASGLKNEVEKVELPEATDDTTASIKIGVKVNFSPSFFSNSFLYLFLQITRLVTSASTNEVT